MDAKLKYFFDLHTEKFEIFKAQDPATGDFDVVFDFNGELLHAHKFQLATISNTFNAMLSERWAKPDVPIRIQEYSYNNFKEFLTFIYSGECNFTEENIFMMVDIAEFYNVIVFKKACEDFLKTILNVNNVLQVLEVANKYFMVNLKTFCEEFLVNAKLDLSNIYQVLEVAYHYSMDDLKKIVFDYISNNLLSFIQAEHFQSLAVNIMKDVVVANKDNVRQEELFEMVHKWAEKQALEKPKPNEDINLNDAIKEEMNGFLPLFKFQLMNSEFLIKFVVTKSFLFTGQQLSDILWSAKYLVSIIDGNGKMLKGILNCPNIDHVYNVIQSQKNWITVFFWSTKRSRPVIPSKLVKNDVIEYYLVYDKRGDLAVKKNAEIKDDDYLLAEMFAEVGFQRLNIQII